MNLSRTIVRIALGIFFVLVGGLDFFMGKPPPQPGLAGAFNDIFFRSHWILFVGAAQVVIGALLVANRYVPLALTMLAAFLYNSFAFHVTMAPAFLPAPIIITALMVFLAWPYRALYAQLFAAVAAPSDRSSTAVRTA